MENEEALFLVSCCGVRVGNPGPKGHIWNEARILAQGRFWDLWRNRLPVTLSLEDISQIDIQVYALVEQSIPLQDWLEVYSREHSFEEAVTQLEHELKVDEESLLAIAMSFAAGRSTDLDVRNAAKKIDRAKERLAAAVESLATATLSSRKKR